MRGFLTWSLSLAALSMGLTAAEPVFTHVHPAGLQRGTTSLVSFTGRFDPWPCQVHTAVPGLRFVSQKEAGLFEVTVDASMVPGPCLLRAFNAEGVSAPVALVITDIPQTPEVEPNDHFRAPQVLTSTIATINGRLEKADDVDSYQVTLTQGQTLVSWVEAHVLAAGCDDMLRVADARGLTLAFNHDGPATMDPLLVFIAPEDGAYCVQIMGHKYPAASDVRFTGGKDCIYRLHLSTGPVVRNPWPLATPREGMMTVEGWNLPCNRIAADSGPIMLYPPQPSCPVELGSFVEISILTAPCAVSGRIVHAGAEERHSFKAAKGETLELAVAGPALGSEIDPWVKVLNAEGKELAVNDDAGGSTEASLIWTAPEAGSYLAVIGDLTQRGGQDFYYRFSLTHPVPGVSATTDHAFKVQAGQTTAVKVNVSFSNGFSVPLTLTAGSLPPGVTAAGVPVPAKGGEVTFTLNAEASAPAASQPLQLFLNSNHSGRDYPVEHRMVSTSENNGVPQGFRQLLIPETAELWLTVTTPPEDKKVSAATTSANP